METEERDARNPKKSLIGQADRVLCDAPCSGLGVIGKKPDIKYRMTRDQIESLVLLQREILKVVSRYVRPGGTLIYSTCTVSRQENQEQRQWFLDHFPFSPKGIGPLGGLETEEGTMRDGYVQLLPGVHPCDGFFIAAFEKKHG